PAANPYLALAAITAAGIDGIVQKLQTEARDGKTEFPETLGVVLRELDNNTFAKSSFGEKLCRMYKEGKQEEWDRFCSHVTDWEMKEYLYRC
ncbi:glutamine synthetase, partial [[Clostridium] symbiosum]